MNVEKQSDRSAGRKAALRATMALIVFCVVVGLVWFADGGQRYVWLKAFHVIAIIAWMAGMVYLPRLFVYHADAIAGGEAEATFKVMERRLLKVIMTPAMVISWVLGLWLAFDAGYWSSGWFYWKLLAVIAMTAAHGYFAVSVKRFAAGQNTISSGRWRAINEVPTVLMVVTVIMVIVKPF